MKLISIMGAEVVLSTSIADKKDMIQDIISAYINFDIALLIKGFWIIGR